ncbi:MAG: 5-bromo-4-chloroindolyl phosphate hydrolysis family protein [Lachnospiraceae bacterium]|jgi:5-bromo-4-chloroindolyl phosphate hydrolysis protein|nr:5-bromo-4-chloroindolyl phosphate hydrolysis family protein [Lachnospiraceae bacterium]
MNNYDDFGEQIKRSVTSSANWINDVINDIHSGVVNQTNNVRNTQTYREVQAERARLQAERQRQLQERTRQRQEMAKRIGHVPTEGNVFRGIGIFFLGTFALGSIGMMFEAGTPIGRLIFYIILAGLSGFGIFKMIKRNRQVKRFAKYVNIIGSQTYLNISDIETTLGYSHKTVIKDLRDMISSGILKQAHIDEEEKYLMVTSEVYDNYLSAKSSYDARAQVEKMRKEEEEAKEREARGERDPELVKTLKQGEDYIRQIKSANDAIPGEEISKKLERLEQVSAQIFTAVDRHPEKLPEIRKFMDYYMPTTLKMVNSYHEFDMQPVQGENIVKAKREIEDTLDMINMAFENLSDRLYEADTMDVKADISVLKTMLAQEGLKEKDFKLDL